MLWCYAAALSLTSASLFREAHGQVVTVIEYASACSAIYTSGSQSVTVVQTTTASPVPLSDQAANSGTPFVLAIQLGTLTKKRQAAQSTYLLANGSLTTDNTLAAQYKINDGQLSSEPEGYISTTPNTPSAIFAASPNIQSISLTFTVHNGVMVWSNGNFTGGVAQLYQEASGPVVARFSGPIDPEWTAVKVAAESGKLRDMAHDYPN